MREPDHRSDIGLMLSILPIYRLTFTSSNLPVPVFCRHFSYRFRKISVAAGLGFGLDLE